MFPKPQPSNEGNPGRHIFPHDRMGVLLTIPGQLEAPTRRIDQEPTDNKIGWKHSPSLQASRNYSSSQQDVDSLLSLLSPRGTRQHCLRKLLPPLDSISRDQWEPQLQQTAKQTKIVKALKSKLALESQHTKVDTTCVLNLIGVTSWWNKKFK